MNHNGHNVMIKRIIALFFLCSILTGVACNNKPTVTYPEPIGYVSDFEKIYEPAERNYLDSIITVYEKKTGIEIALVTIDTSMTSRQDFGKYTAGLAKKWGVGKADKNNGLLIGISAAHHRVRIENGYGIAAVLSNNEAQQILDTAFIPLLAKGLYFEASDKGLAVLMKRLEGAIK
jgi:uncharacterized protein